jgi:hypothetical protein
MNSNDPVRLKWARWAAFASSAVIVVEITPSQILLGLALLLLLLSRQKIRLPPIKWTLALFLAADSPGCLQDRNRQPHGTFHSLQDTF